MKAEIDFPCAICTRHCGRCGRTFCENDVEERKVMIQQAEHHTLLCELCRLHCNSSAGRQ